MDIRMMQSTIDRWIQENGGYWDEMSLLARLTEETGEVARIYNQRFGAKKVKEGETPELLEGELADVLWILLCMANQQGIDLQDAFDKVMDKVRAR
jgi:NTP pyrophosphatase (non-canonical NTP hydrolase)